MNKLLVSRILIVLGLAIGLSSWWRTLQHVADPTYLLVPEFEDAATHAWYHAFREAGGDLAAMVIILFLFFGPKQARIPATWIICLILMIGYYAPFWIGTAFVPELSAPHWRAELVHILMALFPILALFIARGEFYRAK